MCGIAGIYNFETGEQADVRVLNDMLEVIRHRGPDDHGIHANGEFALGMRRLSIIDLEGGHQPIYNEDCSIAVVCNGEIYNYRELADGLRQRGHHFSTDSDAEVIVHLYEELGEECVHRLRGMFGLAIWDSEKRKLFVARDRLGIKPLYYTIKRGRLIFASEIKSLLQHPGVDANCDLASLSHYLSLKYVPAPQTLFTGIASLPPGHLLTCDGDEIRTRSYWDLRFEESNHEHLRDEEYEERLEQLLRESVRLRLRSDVPFGAFLSGGVDSSLIVALMSEMLDEPVKTFSVGFERSHNDSDELPYARLVSNRFQTDHHEMIVGPEDFVNLAERVTWHLDQPLADQATFATFMLAELASQQVKMVLTGEGGDELFAGYARYAGESWSPMFRFVPPAVKSLAWKVGSRLPKLRRAKIGLYALCQPKEAARFANWFPLFNRDMKQAIIADDASDGYDTSTDELFAEHLRRTNALKPLNRMLYLDTKLWLPDLLLMRGDKMTMAHSLEARVPLLDHHLVEFAASMPTRLKLAGRVRKYLLRRVARKFLPDEIIERTKQGFPIPISQWLRRESRDFMYDLLSDDAIRRRGLFQLDYVQRLLREHDNGFADHSLLLWGLMSVELWFRHVSNPVVRRRSPIATGAIDSGDTCVR